MLNQVHELKLPEQLTFSEVGPIYEAINTINELNKACVLDGSLVEQVDFSGVQFVLAYQAKFGGDGKPVLINASDALLKSIVDIGALNVSLSETTVDPDTAESV